MLTEVEFAVVGVAREEDDSLGAGLLDEIEKALLLARHVRPRLEAVVFADELGAHADKDMDEVQISQEVYDLIEPTLIQPTFVMRLHKELVPLAKRCKDNPDLVDVYELVIDGKEISPGYTELNDPIDQRQRLEEQLQRTLGTEEEESGKIDEQFLDALEHGMPPAGGLGLGVDRLCMLLTAAPTIRDIILFPQLKNKSQ